MHGLRHVEAGEPLRDADLVVVVHVAVAGQLAAAATELGNFIGLLIHNLSCGT